MNRQKTPFPAAAFEFAPPERANEAPAGALRQVDVGGLIEDLQEALQSGDIQKGFDIEAAIADPEFMELVRSMPAYAALRVYIAEQSARSAQDDAKETIAARLTSRAALPQPARADLTGAPVRDYLSLSPEEFALLEAQYRAQARAGMPVKL